MLQPVTIRAWTRRAVLQAACGMFTLPLAGVLVATGEVAAQTPPALADAPTPLLRMLSLAPDLVTNANHALSFANFAQAKALNGFGDVHSLADLGDRPLVDFSNAVNGCYAVNDAFTRFQQFGDAFGYDLFQIDRELAIGLPPETVVRLEGEFNPGAIQAKLVNDGYAEASFQGTTYATLRNDYELGLNSSTNFVLAHLNRIAYSDSRILTAAATANIEAMLGGEQQSVPTLAANPIYAALALALGDVTSMAITDNADVSVEGVTDPARYKQYVTGWGTLHLPLLVAMGYTDAGDNGHTMHVAIVYPNRTDAAADAPELVKRLTGYQLLRSNTPLIPTYATAVTSRTSTFMDLSVLIADVALAPDRPRASLWRQMYAGRDTLFLVPDPVIRLAP